MLGNRFCRRDFLHEVRCALSDTFDETAQKIHCWPQHYYDRRNDDVYTEKNIKNTVEQRSVPVWYALLPPLPVALMIIFSPLTFSSIRLNTISALLLVWIAVVVLEVIRRRDVKEVLKDGSCVFKSMGSMFTSIVALIICAEFLPMA